MKRYNYIMGQDLIPSDVSIGSATLPSAPPVDRIGFTALAVGNIDNDPFLDTWFVNDRRDCENMQVNPDGSLGDSGDDVKN